MRNIYKILVAVLFAANISAQTMDVGISTPDEITTLNINYTANGAYMTPFSIWNNQVVSLRWPISAGANVIMSVASETGLIFTLDGTPVDGGDGFLYQKVISSSVNQNIPFASGETKTMAVLTLVDNGGEESIDIEVLDGSNTLSQLKKIVIMYN